MFIVLIVVLSGDFCGLFKKIIEASGGGNVRIPVEIEKEDAILKIKDGKRTLKTIKFKEINELKPVGGGVVPNPF